MQKDHKILVSGATGMLGVHLIKSLLANGYSNIHALRRKESNLLLVQSFQDIVTWHETDILDIIGLTEAMKGSKWVFHCAAMVSYDKRDEKKMIQSNIEGTALMVDIALSEEVEKFCHVSSIAAIGKDPESSKVHEKLPWLETPHTTIYAKTKYRAEQEVWRSFHEGLPVVIVNPSVIIGPGFWNKSSSKLFTKVWEGLSYYGTGTTGFVDVRDVSNFMVLSMESDIVGERFILNSENLDYKSFFTFLATALNKKVPTKPATKWIRALSWRFEWLRSLFTSKRPLITKETAHNSATVYHYENKKSLSLPGFKYVPIQNSIKDTASVFLKSFPNGVDGAVF